MKYSIFLFNCLLSIALNAQSMKIDLSKSLRTGDKVYGAYCGFAGSHPPTRLLVEDLIDKKDIATLSSWLTSPNLVIQTYAAEAFIRLSSSELAINEEDLVLVEGIRIKEDKISTCTGCIYEQLSIKECLALVEPQTAQRNKSEK